MSDAVVSTINTTEFFLGYFGLNIGVGQFGQNEGHSILEKAVNPYGWLPSYTYGYTAGAHYRNMPVSLTLGGYDSARFVPHEIDFVLTASDKSPRPNVRGIQVNAKTKQAGWNGSSKILSTYNESFLALIDSTTPFLWLPEVVCDAFATAFNLTYNETFQVYTLTDDQYGRFRDSEDYSFTFSLSSPENRDNFGQPLDVPGVVNITVPMRSFIGTLQGPYKGKIAYGDPSVAYFMLRKQSNDKTPIIGRGFLQESYLITKYDQGSFRIHQAAFPKDPKADAKLLPVNRTANSLYPGPPTNQPGTHTGLSVSQMVGLIAGLLVLCTVGIFITCCIWRRNVRKNKRREQAGLDDEFAKDTGSTIDPGSPRTPVSRILSKIARKKRSKRTIREPDMAEAHTFEAPNAEIYEIEAPLPPVELDGGCHEADVIGDEELGTDQHLTEYEIAKRKMARQLKGPVPAYAPPANGVFPSDEKRPIRPLNTLLIPSNDDVSPTRSAEGQTNASLPGMMPSPVSPRTGWGTHSTNELPSPVTASNPAHSTSSQSQTRSRRGTATSARSGVSQDHTASRSNSDRSTSDNTSSAQRGGIPQAAIQRAPIDPTKIVCLGPLPDNIQLFRQHVVSKDGGSSAENPATRGLFKAEPHFSEGSLGSNYTDVENQYVEEMTRQESLSSRSHGTPHTQGTSPMIPPWNPSLQAGTSNAKPETTISRQRSNDSTSSGEHKEGRIDGPDLIHVPQMAEKRYSWEEER